ncbi:hypothetical protein [Rhodovulum sulfidophilum]|uniref:hypothetical protein n=1 Tax=Rhodovulum sulfidophilum TaxID=35806 RepID=UPI001F1EE25A|nr:hypothetical protein [Rhodovulum sulfidophilum]
MPSKRYEKRVVDFLLRDEIDALLCAPDPTLWFGRGDRTILTVMLQTGLRVSEVISLRIRDVELGTGAHGEILLKRTVVCVDNRLIQDPAVMLPKLCRKIPGTLGKFLWREAHQHAAMLRAASDRREFPLQAARHTPRLRC